MFLCSFRLLPSTCSAWMRTPSFLVSLLPQARGLSVAMRRTFATLTMTFFIHRWKLQLLLQVDKIFLISRGNWTTLLVISLSSLTRLPDASESRSWYSVTQPCISLSVVPVTTTIETSVVTRKLPLSVSSTVLPLSLPCWSQRLFLPSTKRWCPRLTVVPWLNRELLRLLGFLRLCYLNCPELSRTDLLLNQSLMEVRLVPLRQKWRYRRDWLPAKW